MVEKRIQGFCRREEWTQPLLAEFKQKKPWLFDHSMRVGYVAARLAIHEGLGRQDVLTVLRAGALHDYGKVKSPQVLPDEEPATLAQIELIVNGHIDAGVKATVGYDADIAQIISAHHDSYPLLISEDATDEDRLMVKMKTLVALADRVDGTLSGRPYRGDNPCSDEEIAEELRVFDPELVKVAIAIWRSIDIGQTLKN